MPTTQNRRIVRRAVLTVAALLLLPVWYASAWLTASRAEHDGHISITTAQRIRPAFVPLLDYCESEWPGSGALRHVWWSVNPPLIIRGTGGRGAGIVFDKLWLIPALSPPRTAAVEEFLKAEFPPQPKRKSH